MYPTLPPSLFNGAKHENIQEPVFDETTLDQLKQLRTRILERYNTVGFKYTSNFKHSLPDCHWREIYALHRYQTDVEISPDVRNTPEYDEVLYSPSTYPDNWSDTLLHHFLVARKHDIAAAADMFANYIAWRHRFGVDDLARQQPMPFHDVINSILGHSIHFYDVHGHPLYLQRTGLIDPNEFTERVPDDMLALTHVHHMEMVTNAMHQSSIIKRQRVDKCVTIIDTNHVTLSHAKTVKFFSITSFIDQHFYPELLAHLYMINAPSFLPSLLSMAKRFLDPKTSDKIFALAPSELSKLSENLGSQYIPKEWLGDCQCKEGCIPLISHLRDETEAYVHKLQSNCSNEDIQSVSANVAAGKEWTTSVQLDSDVTLFWLCASVQVKDVIISVSIDHPGTPVHLIVQPVRVDQHVREGKTRAYYRFRHPVDKRTLVIKVDNSYSRFTSKDFQIQWCLMKGPVNVI